MPADVAPQEHLKEAVHKEDKYDIMSIRSWSTLANKGSIFAAALGLYKTAVGTAVLSVPKALADTGLLLFPALLFGFALVAQYGCYLVARTLDMIGTRDLDPARIGEIAYGNTGKWVTVLLTFLDPWGSTIAFFRTLADVLQPLLTRKMGDTKWLSTGMIILYAAVLVFPLMLTRRIASMSWINGLGIIALLGFVISVSVDTVENGKTLSDAPLAKADLNAVVALTVIAFAYDGCQMNVFPFYRGLPTPTDRPKGAAMAIVSCIANMAGALSYYVVGVLAYSVYKDDTDADIMNNLGTSTVNQIMKLTFSLSLLLTIPITLFECTNTLHTHVVGDSRMINVLLNFGLISTAAAVAAFVPSMYAAFGYVGATTATAWTAILPPAGFVLVAKAKYPEVYGGNINDSDDEDAGNLRSHASVPTASEIFWAKVFLVIGIMLVPAFLTITIIQG